MKKGKFILFILGIILIASLIFIGVGVYLNNISKPKYIFSKVIDIYKVKIDNYRKKSKDLDVKDTYSIKGNIEFDLDSEYYKKSTKEEDKSTYKLINNLNKLDTNFKIQKNQSKNTGYIELTSKLDNEDILNASYYINDNTKYYYIKGIVDEYINAGGCNYFESINKDTTEEENIEYLYNFIINSIKNNLKDQYFETKEEKDYFVVSIKLNNSDINVLMNNVLKDLRNDKKSRNILDNVDKNILKTKFKKNILEKDEYYKISIYTTKILHNPVKFKVEDVTNSKTKTYTYEGNENKGTLYYMDNDVLKYKYKLEFKKDEIKGKIYNSSNKEIGEFRLDKDKYNTTINYTINTNNKKLDLIYSSKYTKVKKNTSYTNIKNLSFKYIENKETKLNGDITATFKVDTKFSILVDVDNAKLQTNLTDKEKEKLENLSNKIKDRLER